MEDLGGRAAELERLVAESAELLKRALREYREAIRARPGAKSLDRKRRLLERASAQYLLLRKELEQLRDELREPD